MEPTLSNEAAPEPAASTSARHRRPSLRLRLTLWMMVIALVIQLTLGLVVFLYQASALTQMFDDRLRERSEPLASALEKSSVRAAAPQVGRLSHELLTFPTNEPRFVMVY